MPSRETPGSGINPANGLVRCVVRGNYVAGNAWGGMHIHGPDADRLEVSGNRLGVDPATQATVTTPGVGVLVERRAVEVLDNVVRGHEHAGIALRNQVSVENLVERNLVAECGVGLQLETDAARNTLRNNVLDANRGAGVLAWPDAGVENHMEGNTFTRVAPGYLAIDLGADGPTPNDPFDQDEGPNRLQNHPVLYGAVPTSTGVIVYGVFGQWGPFPVTLEFYESAASQQRGEGAPFATRVVRFFGEFVLPIDGQVFSNGHFISATATDRDGNTSELCVAVPVAEWVDHGLAVGGSLGDPVCTPSGKLSNSGTALLSLTNARPQSPVVLLIGYGLTSQLIFGRTLIAPYPYGALHRMTSPTGTLAVPIKAPLPNRIPFPVRAFFQFLIFDRTAPFQLTSSNVVSTLVR